MQYKKIPLRYKIAGAILGVGMLCLTGIPLIQQKNASVTTEMAVAQAKETAAQMFRSLREVQHLSNLHFLKAWVSDFKSEAFVDDQFDRDVWADQLNQALPAIRRNVGDGYLLLYDADAELLDSAALSTYPGEKPQVQELEPVQQAVFAAVENDRPQERLFSWAGRGLYRVDVVPILDADLIVSNLLVTITDFSALLNRLAEFSGFEVKLVHEDLELGSFSAPDWSPAQSSYIYKDSQGLETHKQLFSLPFATNEFGATRLYFLMDKTNWQRGLVETQNQALLIGLLFLVAIGLGGWQLGKSIARPVLDVAQSIDTEMTRMRSVAENVVSRANEISTASKNQNEAVTATIQSMNAILNDVTETAKIAAVGRKDLNETLSATNEGAASNKELTENIRKLKEGTVRLADIIRFVETVQGSIKEIEAIVFESKILSFNASVEAERAGAAGRSFSVVAKQVGLLAKNCGQVSEDIRTTVKAGDSNVRSIIDFTKKSIAGGESSQRENLHKFEEVESKVNSLFKRFSHIEGAMQKQSQGVQRINNDLLDLTSKSQANLQHSRNLSLQSKELDDVTDVLNEALTQLRESISGTNDKSA